MAWTTPITAVFNATFTAAQWNASVRDNSNETMPGKATTAGRWFISTGANAIAERAISYAEVLTSQSTSSTSYTALTTAGPAVTVTTGTRAMVFISARMSNSTDNAECWMSFAVSGATTSASSDTRALSLEGAETSNANAYGCFHYFDSLTAGSNTFTAQYKAGSGTATFENRRMLVMAM